MASDIYGKDVQDGAEAIASEGLRNETVIDVHGESDSRIRVHIEESLREDQSDTDQDGSEGKLGRDGSVS